MIGQRWCEHALRTVTDEVFFIPGVNRPQVQSLFTGQAEPPPELDEINRKLADKYFCNLSVFQSMPDVWGIGQVFPIVPLQRLDEAPERRASLQDLTCDSDGRLDRFEVGPQRVRLQRPAEARVEQLEPFAR